MNMDNLALALREVTETKNLVASLLVSSESFDYAQARLALKALNQKVRDLSRVQARLEKEHGGPSSHPANVCVVDFSRAGLPKAQPRGSDSHNAPRRS